MVNGYCMKKKGIPKLLGIVMQIRLAPLIIYNLLLGIVSLLVEILCLEKVRSKMLLHGLVLRLSV